VDAHGCRRLPGHMCSSHEKTNEEPGQRSHNHVASKYKRQDETPIQILPSKNSNRQVAHHGCAVIAPHLNAIRHNPEAIYRWRHRLGAKWFIHRSHPRAVSSDRALLAGRVSIRRANVRRSQVSSRISRRSIMPTAPQSHALIMLRPRLGLTREIVTW